MKRFAFFMSIASLLCVLTACGRKEPTPTTTPTTKPPVTTEATKATMPQVDPTMGTNIPDPSVDTSMPDDPMKETTK